MPSIASLGVGGGGVGGGCTKKDRPLYAAMAKIISYNTPFYVLYGCLEISGLCLQSHCQVKV